MFGGDNPINRVEFNGHVNATESSGPGAVTPDKLEPCGQTAMSSPAKTVPP
jgi:hypothetical protein